VGTVDCVVVDSVTAVVSDVVSCEEVASADVASVDDISSLDATTVVEETAASVFCSEEGSVVGSTVTSGVVSAVVLTATEDTLSCCSSSFLLGTNR